MDEMNPLENQLQSWTPRRPSPKIARRLFGAASRPSPGVVAWNWLSPVAACALTMLVAVHAANRPPGHLSHGSNMAFSASTMLDASSFSQGQTDENMEVNIWSHATDPRPAPAPAEASARQATWVVIPSLTNR
jgi:hypothetical protein